MDGESHWIANEGGFSGRRRYLWLPDSRLLWLDDDGRLLVTEGSGQAPLDLNAPEEVTEIWPGAIGTAVVRGKNAMWQVDLVSGGWSKIEGAPDPENLSVSLDGTYVMAVRFDQVTLQYWRLPLANGEAARLLAEGLIFAGTGRRVRPPVPIPNSSLWFTGERIYFEEGGFSDVGVIDAFEGVLAPMRDFLDIPIEWTREYEISPDKRWMLLGGEYITSGEDLNQGLFVNGSVLGWESDPAGVYLLVDHPEGASWDEITSRSVEFVALPGGECTVLFESLDRSLVPALITQDLVYALDSENIGSVVIALSMQGEVLGSLGLPELDYIPGLTLTSPSVVAIEMTVRLRDEADDTLCLSEYLWLWDIKP